MRYLPRKKIFYTFNFSLLLQIFFVQAQSPTLEAIKSYPFPTELTAASKGTKIAWAFNEEGIRNVYVAEGPDFKSRKLTGYNNDDGQEITSLSISDDGKWVVYVRGGDHGSNWNSDLPVNTNFNPIPPKVQIWSVPFAGGEPKALAEADEPVVSPNSDSVVFIKSGQTWIAPIDASAIAKNLFTTNGNIGTLRWSPDGSRLAFTSNRVDHRMIGVYTMKVANIKWIAPSFKTDNYPAWSPDGNQIAYIQTEGRGGSPDSLLARRHQPWSILTADVASGKVSELWKAPKTFEGSIPTTHGGHNLHWAAKNRIIFLSYMDGWPHIYSIAANGGAPMLLTPGKFMAEHIKLSPDRQSIVFSANTGPDELDIDRRHVAQVSVDMADMNILSPGSGLEWSPVFTGDGSAIAIISATAQRPPLPAILDINKKGISLLAAGNIPASYPDRKSVV